MQEHLEFLIVKNNTFFSLFVNSIFAKLLLVLLLAFISFTSLAENSLPADLQWQTNNSDPLLGSEKAKRGGRFSNFIISYPTHFSCGWPRFKLQLPQRYFR